MSFLGGAECSTAANPLSQFAKHVQDDKSLQRDRLVGRGPGGMQEGMRSQGVVGGQDKMMDEFLRQNIVPLPQGPAPAFAMEQMRRELDSIQTPPLRSHNASPGWAAEFNPQLEEQARMEAAFRQGPKHAGLNPAEFAQLQHMAQSGAETAARPMSTPQTLGAYQRPIAMGYGGMGMGMGVGMNMGMMGQPSYIVANQNLGQGVVEGKGKGKMVELDDENWEAQFAQIDAEGQKDLDAEANAAIERELDDMDKSVASETNEFGDFEPLWRSIQAETAASRAETSAHMMGQNFDFSDMDQWDGFEDIPNIQTIRDPQLGDYLFEEGNLYKDVGDPFGEGVRIMQEGGNLSLAALAFEAAVQKDPDHVRAWTMLGHTQAQNEKESPAIRALEQALKLDSDNLEALMGLAVSYTNEGYDSTAYRTLERWLATKYPQIISKNDLSPNVDVGFTDRHQLHEKVTNLFIRAAQLSPAGEQMDPDVQVGLGVLFYGAEEYSKAVDCFSAALASTESGTSNRHDQIHLLWNRLGATLANSGRSEEAISAYEKALTLNPNFVRARYNLGVSCINIGCYAEAAQHLLGALAMHKVVEREGRERAREVVGGEMSEGELERLMCQNQSTNLYDTLRRVFSQMGRRDLSDLVVTGMDVEVFRKEFEF
ncbi:hypothetical protein FGG08_006196 [Glutinoglossum americanum]|uniref:Peroxisomal targeting signal receptor n=1 Tax=Glutinoglossum americanum TaxID=1670608 RepID=A0A9P8I1E2_9PEZI|nr:hypothetical protein FGG08_006196 [Glutinoglossum americanum]